MYQITWWMVKRTFSKTTKEVYTFNRAFNLHIIFCSLRSCLIDIILGFWELRCMFYLSQRKVLISWKFSIVVFITSLGVVENDSTLHQGFEPKNQVSLDFQPLGQYLLNHISLLSYMMMNCPLNWIGIWRLSEPLFDFRCNQGA